MRRSRAEATHIRIVNLVATTDAGQRIDLRKVGKLPGCTYDETVYKGKVAYVKVSGMAGKISVFASGKLISVGTKSAKSAKKDIRIARNLLEKAGLVHSGANKISVQNVVGLVSVPYKFDIERLARKLHNVIYEPEQFPGAIVRFDIHPRITTLVFASGRLIIAGAKSESSLKAVASDVLSTLGKIEGSRPSRVGV